MSVTQTIMLTSKSNHLIEVNRLIVAIPSQHCVYILKFCEIICYILCVDTSQKLKYAFKQYSILLST